MNASARITGYLVGTMDKWNDATTKDEVMNKVMEWAEKYDNPVRSLNVKRLPDLFVPVDVGPYKAMMIRVSVDGTISKSEKETDALLRSYGIFVRVCATETETEKAIVEYLIMEFDVDGIFGRA